MDNPGVIYCVPCQEGCDKIYIGETKRTANVRTKEEAALCRKVDKAGTIKDDKTNDLGLAVHHKSTQHAFRFDHTLILYILSSETNFFRRKATESMLILANKHRTTDLKNDLQRNSWNKLIRNIESLRII